VQGELIQHLFLRAQFTFRIPHAEVSRSNSIGSSPHSLQTRGSYSHKIHIFCYFKMRDRA
jgi:hypothetical protein